MPKQYRYIAERVPAIALWERLANSFCHQCFHYRLCTFNKRRVCHVLSLPQHYYPQLCTFWEVERLWFTKTFKYRSDFSSHFRQPRWEMLGKESGFLLVHDAFHPLEVAGTCKATGATSSKNTSCSLPKIDSYWILSKSFLDCCQRKESTSKQVLKVLPTEAWNINSNHLHWDQLEPHHKVCMNKSTLLRSCQEWYKANCAR